LIHGPRQCGKTTLAQVVGQSRDYTYFSLDEDVTLAAAIGRSPSDLGRFSRRERYPQSYPKQAANRCFSDMIGA